MTSSPVGIFWDYENCRLPAGMSGYVVAERIRQTVQQLGIITAFKAYFDINSEASKGVRQHELQCSGVSLIHTPHIANRKDVADKVLLVDLLAFAFEGQAKKSIVLITGDSDFSYAISTLRLRGHDVYVISSPGATHPSLEYIANGIWNWKTYILMQTDAPSRNCHLSDKGQSVQDTTSLADVDTGSQRKLLSSIKRDCAGFQSIETPTYCIATSSNPTLDAELPSVLESNEEDESHHQTAYAADLEDYTLVYCPEEAPVGPTLAESKDGDHPVILTNCAVFSRTISSSNAEVPKTDVSPHPCPFDVTEAVALSKHRHVPLDTFSDLVRVLERERSLGRLSTACGTVETLLLDSNPQAYEVAGVTDLEHYLEAARRAGLVRFLGINWELKSGFVMLSAQAIGFRRDRKQPIQPSPSVEKIHQSEASVGPWFEREIDPNYLILVHELRNLRSLGLDIVQQHTLAARIRERDPFIYTRVGLSKARGYFKRASKIGIIVIEQSKKGISLHPDYY